MSKNVKNGIPDSAYESKYAAYRKENSNDAKPENAKGTLIRFLSLIKPHAIPMIIVVLSASASSLCNVISPEYIGEVINQLQDLITGRLNGKEIVFDSCMPTVYRLAVIYGISSIFTFFQEFFSAGVSQKLVCSLRERLNAKLSRLPLSYFDKQTKGQVISKIINDIENVSSSLQSSILTVMTGIIQVIGSLVMMLRTGNIWMTLVAVCLVPFTGTISYKVSKISKKWFKKYWDTMGDMNGHIEEMYAGHTIVRIFGHERQSVEEFRSITERLGKTSFTANMISVLLVVLVTDSQHFVHHKQDTVIVGISGKSICAA